MECRHFETDEVQSDKDFRKISQWTRSVRPRLVVIDENRQYKAFRLLDGSGGEVEVGTAKYPKVELGEAVSPRVMPSQGNRTIKIGRVVDDRLEVEIVKTPRARLACEKWTRAELYKVAKSGSSKVVNYAALDELLADLE
jgi:hypothetical protein